MAETVPIRDLAIYLIKDDGRSLEDYVPSRKKLRRFQVGEGTGSVGVLFVKLPKSAPPRWTTFFDDFLDPTELGRVSSSSAVFLVPTHGRIFALTFGQGRFLLEEDCWEERFGLRVALNSVRENSLRSVDKVTFDAIAAHTRTQSSRTASAMEFGLDVEQDLVRAVTGVPSDETLGRRVTGMDALHAAVRVEMNGLRGLLGRYLEKYQDLSYRISFPWVDHIAEVANTQDISALDAAACERINNGGQRCWLAIPDIIDWTRVSRFRFGTSAKAPQLTDVALADFVDSLGKDQVVTPERLASRHVHAVDDDGNMVYSWTIRRALYCEIEKDGSTFVLSSGQWYRIDGDFVSAVDAYFSTVPKADVEMPSYRHASEAKYCEAVAKGSPSAFALLDQKLIAIGGRYGRIEACDLFTASNHFIHVKRYGASAVLSHLFAQGAVSGEAFCLEPEFRKQMLALLPSGFGWAAEVPSTSEFCVVFAIVSGKAGDLTIPFFSRVSLRQTLKRLQAFGYRTALAKISVDEAFAKTKKYDTD